MLNTVRATVTPSGTIVFDEAVNLVRPTAVLVTLLDEAVAELGLEAAKREALVRTFEASGKTVAEFSDMYGLDAAEVARVVERVGREKAAAAAEALASQGVAG